MTITLEPPRGPNLESMPAPPMLLFTISSCCSCRAESQRLSSNGWTDTEPVIQATVSVSSPARVGARKGTLMVQR